MWIGVLVTPSPLPKWMIWKKLRSLQRELAVLEPHSIEHNATFLLFLMHEVSVDYGVTMFCRYTGNVAKSRHKK